MIVKKTLLSILSACIFAGAGTIASAQHLESFIPNYQNSAMYQLKKDQQEVWQGLPLNKQKGWKQYNRWEYFWKQRLYPNGQYKDAIDIYSNVLRDFSEKRIDALQSKQWDLIGPVTNPEKYNKHVDSKGLGRINVVRFHPTDVNEFWVGSASGGVWRTKDKGKTWENFPFTQFLSLGVSDIAISPTNPNIVYVATGDANGSLGTAGYFASIGIVKTTDGGKTWDITGIANEMKDGNIISRLFVSPTNPDVVIAATNRGIYKSIDGGATWTVKQGGTFRDLEQKPNDENTLYAATAGRSEENYIFKSVDAGETWTLIRTIREAGRIQLAVSPAAPDNLYTLCSQFYHSGFHSFQISDDGGETFSIQADSSNGNYLNWGYDLSETNRGQSYYDLSLAVKNTDPDKVILGGIECHRSSDAGSSWIRSTNTKTAGSTAHADQHDLVYNPLNNELYLCNDGGIYVSEDDGVTWTDITSGISITQYYRFSSSTSNPDHIICGAQDNGTSMYYNGNWYMLYGGDGMDCAIDPFNDNTLYASIYYGSIYKSSNNGKDFSKIISVEETGEQGAWVAPFTVDPTNQGTIYAGFNNVWKSTNYGETWKKISDFKGKTTLDQIKVAPSNSNYIYAITNATLYKTSDGGANWTTIASAPNSITSVAISPNDPNLIWYTLSGYNSTSKVIMYDGTTSTNLSGNLPNVPVNAIVYQNDSPDRVYVGTDIGMFYSDNRSNIWDNINANLPNVIVNDLEIYYGYGTSTPKLRAATYGRGVWQSDVITCNSPAITLSQTGTIQKCPGTPVTIEADGDYSSYKWSDGTSGKTLTTTLPGTYSVQAMDGDCKVRSYPVTIEDIITPTIAASIANNQPACIGDTIELTATARFNSYLWSTGETTRTIKVWEDGAYSVSGSKGTECDSYSDTLHVKFYPVPEKMGFTAAGNVLTADEMVSYQWYKDGVAIKGATGQTFDVTESGLYKVYGANEGRCGCYSDELYVEFSGVNDSFKNTFAIYPNPSENIFDLNLSCESGDIIEFVITNTQGKQILTGHEISNSEEFRHAFDLSGYASGVYILTLKVNNQTKATKLVKR